MCHLEYLSKSRADRKARLRCVTKFRSKRTMPVERQLSFPFARVVERIGELDPFPYYLAFGASGCGKTRFIVRRYLEHLGGLLGTSRDHRVSVKLIDPLAESSRLLWATFVRQGLESTAEVEK